MANTGPPIKTRKSIQPVGSVGQVTYFGRPPRVSVGNLIANSAAARTIDGELTDLLKAAFIRAVLLSSIADNARPYLPVRFPLAEIDKNRLPFHHLQFP